MDRRKTLRWFGVAALGLTLPVAASQSTDKVPIVTTKLEDGADTVSVNQAVACKIIGVGNAGCNIVTKAFIRDLQVENCHPQFACVSMGLQSIAAAHEANELHPCIAPIAPVQLGRFSAHGNVNTVCAAAHKNEGALHALIDGADIVILVAGIGGGTGSAVAPILASMAEESGALVLGVVVTPFNWELGRYHSAFAAVRALERHSHYLVSLPNEKVGQILGSSTALDEVFAQQELIGTACLQRLIVDGSRFCIDRTRSATQ